MPQASLKRQHCAVCGRGILYGERTYDYETPGGDVRDVCALCRPSAERVGWVPPGRSGRDAKSPGHPRRSWTESLGPKLSGLLSARPGGANATPGQTPALPDRAGSGPVEPAGPAPDPASPTLVRQTDVADRHDAAAQTEPAGQGEPRVNPQTPRAASGSLPEAVRTFNASSLPRMVAGLTRSLGAASAEVRHRGAAASITVAWELSWYEWEVSGLDLNEVGKGAELSEREGPAPEWNAQVEDDGRLTLLDSP